MKIIKWFNEYWETLAIALIVGLGATVLCVGANWCIDGLVASSEKTRQNMEAHQKEAGYPIYGSQSERDHALWQEMKRANDLKEKELELLKK